MINEIREQLAHVIEALEADLYHPIGEIELEGFLAPGALTLAEAETYARTPWPAGKVWGKAWDYAWMFGSFTVPEEARGERIVMDLNPGGESVLFVNGKVFGGIYDDRLLVKPTKSALTKMPEAPHELPYEGAKEMLLVEDVDNRDFLRELVTAMHEELPAPKKR